MKEFINRALDKIKTLYPKATIMYEYNTMSQTHFIKITPSEFYNDEGFLDLEFELMDAFNALVLDESLCFITEDALVDLKNPSIVIKPESKMVSLLDDALFENVFDSKIQLMPDLSLGVIANDSSWYAESKYTTGNESIQKPIISLTHNVFNEIDVSNSGKQKMAA